MLSCSLDTGTLYSVYSLLSERLIWFKMHKILCRFKKKKKNTVTLVSCQGDWCLFTSSFAGSENHQMIFFFFFLFH